MENAREMFIHELADTRDAETKLLTALERMSKKVSDENLKQLILNHREETQGQLERLDQVFEEMGEKPKRQPCKGMSGLIEEFQHFVKEEKPEDDILDVYAVGASIKVERYEISSYESLISMARKLGMEEAAGLLEQNLEEEKAALSKLEELGQDLLGQLPEEDESEEEEEEEIVSSGRKGRSR